MTKNLETKISNTVHSIEPSPEFSEKLWKEIQSTPHQKPAFTLKRFSRWLWIPASATLTLAIILFAVQPLNVMAYFRNLLGYLPGIGLVQDDESTLYLSEPITFEQDDLILTISQVVADENKIVVAYQIDGIPTDHTGKSLCFYDNNRLLLPDGTSRLPIGGEVTNNTARIEFMPFPAGITQATLLTSMDFPDPACSAPEEWSVQFSLDTTIPPEINLMPVIMEHEPQTPAADQVVSKPTESNDADVQFIFEKIAVLEDGYLLFGHTTWTKESWQNVRIDMNDVFALDAKGKDVPLEQTNEGNKDNEFAFKIVTKDFSTPLTFHIQNLLISANYENGPTFSFEPGYNPQIGQSWNLNKEIEFEGQKIYFDTVQVVQSENSLNQENAVYGYSFEVDNAKNINLSVECSGQKETSENPGTWGQARPVDETSNIFETYFPSGLPDGEVTCYFSHALFQLHGSWDIEWQLPVEN